MFGFPGKKRSMRPAVGLGDDQDTFGLFVMTSLCWPDIETREGGHWKALMPPGYGIFLACTWPECLLRIDAVSGDSGSG